MESSTVYSHTTLQSHASTACSQPSAAEWTCPPASALDLPAGARSPLLKWALSLPRETASECICLAL